MDINQRSFLVFLRLLMLWERGASPYARKVSVLFSRIKKLLIGTNGSTASRIFPSHRWKNLRKARNLRMAFRVLPC